MSGRVRVAVRTRPTASFAQEEIFIDPPVRGIWRPSPFPQGFR